MKLLPFRVLPLASVLLASFVGLASAAPISLTGQILGDPRTGNFHDLFIDVTITGDTTSNQVSWKVDINTPNHPNAKLDEFYFNMIGLGSDYSFSGFNPTGWDINSPASSQGGGNMNLEFLFEALDPSGPPNADDVTNTQDLTFTMTKASGNFLASDFLNAFSSCSSDTELPCGQMGAHLQALQQGQSGFLVGNYAVSSSGGTPGSGGAPSSGGQVPEPNSSSLVLLAMGLLGASFWARRGAAAKL